MFGLNFQVKRERYSVTQGAAVVYLNNHEIARFHDPIELINGVWQSVQSDETFIKGALIHPFDELYQASKHLKDYLVKTHRIQKVSAQELSDMFDQYFDYMESSDPNAQNGVKKGLFYTKAGDRFVSLRNLKGECDAEDFSTEVEALCWLVAQ